MQSRILSEIPRIAHDFGAQGESPPDDAFRLKQVHSSEVIFIGAGAVPEETGAIRADGMVCGTPGKTIAIQTGDCLPLLFADQNKPLVGATHAGWRGLSAGIIARSLETLALHGATPSTLRVAIGPAIGPCCFEVDSETSQAFSAFERFLFRAQPKARANAHVQAKPSTNDLWIDLAGIAGFQLETMGVPSRQIEILPVCTYCSGQPFASYRRACHEKRTAGRQWSRIRLL